MLKLKTILVASVFFVILGCASAEIYKDNGIEKVSGIGMSCTKPVLLTQDCSNIFGATQKIQIETFTVNIAGSTDGKTIFVMDSSPVANSLKTGLVLSTKDYSTQASDDGFNATKRLLATEDIAINRVVVVEAGGSVFGYILEVSKPAYSLLKTMAIE